MVCSHGQGEWGLIFRNFVRTSLMDGSLRYVAAFKLSNFAFEQRQAMHHLARILTQQWLTELLNNPRDEIYIKK